jgi:5-hydroxyisourate hydrolase-like protein (transthyretin family)
MKSKVVFPISSAVFLVIGVFIGYMLFHGAGGEDILVPEKPADSTARGSENRDERSDKSVETLIKDLRERNTKLEQENKSLKAQLERAEESKNKAGERRNPPALPYPVDPPPSVPDCPSILNPAELKEGKGGLEGYFIHANGSPAKGVSVSLYRHTGEFRQYKTKTDSTGHFKILDLNPGKYHASTEMLPKTQCTWPQRYVQIKAGEITRADFGGSGNIAVKGRALSANRKPIAKAILLLIHVNRGMEGGGLSYSAMTDDDGCFTFLNLKPEKYQWTLQGLNKVSYGFGKIQFSESGPFEWNIELPSTKISGIVIDRNSGSPVSGAIVNARLKGSVKSPGSYIRSDDQGLFLFEGLSAGTYEITASSDRYVMKRANLVKLTEGQAIENIRIILDPAAVFKVTVLDSNGKPIKNVRVLLIAVDDKGEDSCRTLHFKANGIAVVDNLLPGKYNFEVSAEGYLSDSKSDILLSQSDNPMLEFMLKKE